MRWRELRSLSVMWAACLLGAGLVVGIFRVVSETGLADWWYGQDWYADHAHPEVVVEMRDFAFSPRTITVFAGTTVRWVNQGQVPYTVTADDGSFDSGQVGPGGTFSRPGRYPYYCQLHGGRGVWEWPEK